MVFRPFYGICFLFFYWTAHSISYLKILPDSINILLEFLLKKVVSKKLSYTFTTVCLPKCEDFSKIKTGGKQKKYEIFFYLNMNYIQCLTIISCFFHEYFLQHSLINHVKLRKNFCEWRDFYRPYCTIYPNFSIPDPGLCKIYIIKIKTNQGSRFQPLLPARFSGQVPMGASL
jgi:hypothetical protein